MFLIKKIIYCFFKCVFVGYRGDCLSEVIIFVCFWAVVSIKKGMMGSSLVIFYNRCFCWCYLVIRVVVLSYCRKGRGEVVVLVFIFGELRCEVNF